MKFSLRKLSALHLSVSVCKGKTRYEYQGTPHWGIEPATSFLQPTLELHVIDRLIALRHEDVTYRRLSGPQGLWSRGSA
jgi:hypothetical protein